MDELQQGEPARWVRRENTATPMRSSNDDAIAAAKYVETLARNFTALNEQFEAETREHQYINDTQQARFHELELLHTNCIRAARGQDIKNVVNGQMYHMVLPKSEWPDEVKEIYELRSRVTGLEAIERKERSRADEAEVKAKIFQDKFTSLLRSLVTAQLPSSGLLSSTRRAIGRILKRHNKAS